jgi:Xaa-Pro aminopeptidase
MKDIRRGFDGSEYEQRIAAIQGGMREAGIDAVLFTTEADIRYVTGFLTRFWESPTRPWFVVLPAAAKPVAVIPSIGHDLMATTWMEDIRTWSSPNPDDEGISLLASTIAELSPPNGRIGVPMGPETHLRMPLADFNKLSSAIEPREFVDATTIVRRVREIKSEAEIRKIGRICNIASRAFDTVPELAASSDPLDQVFRQFQIACLEGGADHVAYLAGGAGPDGYPDVISPPTSRPLSSGDILMIDTGAVFDGYFCDFDRNYSVGKPSDNAKRAYEVLYAATEAGFAAARPGQLSSDIWHAINDVITASDFEPLAGRLGHGLGIQLTEWPSLMASDHTALREGMVLTLEPGLQVMPGRIMVHEENIVIRQTGAEMLSPRAPLEFPVLR